MSYLENMYLNVGSSYKIKGIYLKPEWINLDICKAFTEAKYVTGTAIELPFRNDSFEQIRAIHCLEHIERKDHNLFYKEMYRVLKPKGSLFIEVPDFYKLCEYFCRIYNYHTDNLLEKLRICTLSFYGKGRHVGDYHHWGFTYNQLEEDLKSHGFLPARQLEMISNHYKYEPIILVRAEKS